jgi:hypothetical protein
VWGAELIFQLSQTLFFDSIIRHLSAEYLMAKQYESWSWVSVNRNMPYTANKLVTKIFGRESGVLLLLLIIIIIITIIILFAILCL